MWGWLVVQVSVGGGGHEFSDDELFTISSILVRSRPYTVLCRKELMTHTVQGACDHKPDAEWGRCPA
jgi:hypothetical protein